MNGIRYASEHLAWMKDNRTLTEVDFHEQFQKVFNVSASLGALSQKRRSLGWKTGRHGGDDKGEGAAWMLSTRLEIGTERFQGGILHRKISRKDWKPVHILRWEETYGKIPKGIILLCNGKKLNTEPSNWEAVDYSIVNYLTRPILGVKYNDAPEELKPTMMASAKLKAALHRMTLVRKESIAAGVCACCSRSVSDLRRHMAVKHPTFVVDPVEGKNRS